MPGVIGYLSFCQVTYMFECVGAGVCPYPGPSIAVVTEKSNVRAGMSRSYKSSYVAQQ